MNRFRILLTLLLFPVFLQGQTIYTTDYDWSQQPEYVDPSKLSLTPEQEKSNALYLFNIDVYKLPGLGVFMWFHTEIKHMKILVQSKKGIEELNKFYLPIKEKNTYWGGTYDETEVKARIIQSDGSCVAVSRDSIFKGELDGRLYNYFAFDNLKIGSIIEIFIKTPKVSDGYPSEFLLTQKYPTLSRIIAYHSKANLDPLIYQPKGDEVKYEEQIDQEMNNRLLLFKYESLSAAKRQELSNYANDNLFLHIQPANRDRLTDRMKMLFELNLGYSSAFYKKREGKPLKKSLKNSEKFIDVWFIKSDTSAIVKLRRAEFFLKTKNETFMLGLNKSGRYLVNQVPMEKFRLMYTYSKLIGLEPKLIFASRGDYHATPENFVCPNYFNFPLIYFPGLDVYYSVDPDDRIGPAPTRFLNSNAVYFNIHGKPKIEPFKIHEPRINFSTDSLSIQLSFQGDEAKAEFKEVLIGNTALDYLVEINGAREGKILEERESLIRYYFPKSDILSTKAKNETLDRAFVLPLTIYSTLKCNDLVVDLDSILIVELGSVIGNQRELSEDENSKRETGIYLENNTHYVRELSVSIPAGYKVKNVNDFILEFGGNELFGFKSDARIVGNKLMITVDEYYNKTSYLPEDYELMKQVYSASHKFYTTKLFLAK